MGYRDMTQNRATGSNDPTNGRFFSSYTCNLQSLQKKRQRNVLQGCNQWNPLKSQHVNMPSLAISAIECDICRKWLLAASVEGNDAPTLGARTSTTQSLKTNL